MMNRWWVSLGMLLVAALPAAQGQGPPPALPPDYPATHVADEYARAPFEADYALRREAFLAYQAANPGNGPYSEAARIMAGKWPDERRIRSALDRMDAREDCADFGIHGILRLLYQFGGSPLLSDSFRAQARASILGFKYWPDEPGIDSMCTWSENHHILFSSAAYLTGQLYPDAVFANSGRSGREQMAVFRPRVLRWLDLRYRTGFSEWLSNVYYDEDLAALLNLVDFCEDEEIALRAAMVVDLLLADLALNQFQGTLGSTHGRSYESHKKRGEHDNTGPSVKLLFGMNAFRVGNMAACSLALSERYRMPRVLYEIATDLDRAELVNKQRMGIRLRDAQRWGLDCNRLEDGMTFLSLEAYSHPKTINLTMRMFDAYNWWENDFFEPFQKKRKLITWTRRLHLLPLVTWYYRHDYTRNMREEVNIYTYRTPDYLLSTAQDYRKGYGGDQQHIWQATLGPDAVCFTTHPAGGGDDTPNYWAGSGTLPRAAQVENVAIILYKIRTKRQELVKPEFLLTHAWFPKDQYDEVVERDGWIFGRSGDGYIALWSRQPYVWQTKDGDDQDREAIALGKENIWICELGRRGTDGEFSTFIQRVSGARLQTRGLRVSYESPSQGTLEFSWSGAFRQNGRPVDLHDYPRYANPYMDTPFPGEEITLRHKGQSLCLNWATLEREASAFL